MLLIGSRALAKFTTLRRVLSDYDYIATREEVDAFLLDNANGTSRIKGSAQVDYIVSCRFNNDKYEFHIARPGSALWEYLKLNEGREYAGMATLYSIKLGHIHFSSIESNFCKHMGDITILGALLQRNDVLAHITKKHYNDTKNRAGIRRMTNLNKTQADFFDQSEGFVSRLFVHDEVHMIVAHGDQPMYTRMQPDKNLVTCSKKMWDEFSNIDKIYCVAEEAYVIALERKILPMVFKGHGFHSSQSAFEWALWRICTSLCSGWYRRFAVDFYEEVLGYHDREYASKFFQAIDEGRISLISNV